MRWVVYTNLYVAGCGAALTAASYTLFGQPATLGPVAAIVFCCTLVIYNLDRLVEPSPGDSEHERWVERHRRPLWALTLLASIGAGVSAIYLSAPLLLSLAPAGVVALGYCVPVLPWRGRRLRLKQLPGAKLLLIAGVWAYATAGLPMIDTGAAINIQTIAILLGRLLFLAAVALPFDVPDMQRDRQSGIATLPTLLGLRATRRAAVALALGSLLLATIGPWPQAWAPLTASACTLMLATKLREGRGLIYFMVALDGMLLVQAAALWIVTG